MENKLKKYITNISMDELDYDSFCESLLFCVAKTKEYCAHIDKIVKRKAAIPFTPWCNVMDCYDDIINEICVKGELIELFTLFMNWYKGLNEKKKRLCVAYFIKRDKDICRRIEKAPRYYERLVLPMARNFLGYVLATSDFTKQELLENYCVCQVYTATLRRNERRKKKGGCKYDNSANERCHC